MPATTPKLKIPYPLPGDAVIDYPTTGRQLAELLEALSPIVGTHPAPVTTGGATFAAGNDLLPAPLAFTADGLTSYRLSVAAGYVTGEAAGVYCHFHVNLDGADLGFIGSVLVMGAGNVDAKPVAAAAIIKPAAGPHTVNVRIVKGGNSGNPTVGAGAGGLGNYYPILVSLEPVVVVAIAAQRPGPGGDEPEAASK